MKKMLLIFGGSLGIYIAITLLIAVIPAIDLSQTPAGPDVKPLTALEQEGRDIYAANGCAYCHTQQVRPLSADSQFGRPSAPGDFAYRTPGLLGSERTGPDLSNAGKDKPSMVWQYIHLYDPRAVEPHSIMPDFKFLFRVVDKVPEGETAVPVPAEFAPEHGKIIPTHKAKALVAYLLSLKQAPIPGYKMNGGMGGVTSVTPAAPTVGSESGEQQTGASAASGYQYAQASGKSLYAAHCSACHQASGQGIPGAFPPLQDNPAVDDDDPTLHLDTILHGAHGKTIDGVAYNGAMPGFADQLSDAQIADIANYERTSWGNQAQKVTPADVADVRAGKNLSPEQSGPVQDSDAAGGGQDEPAAPVQDKPQQEEDQAASVTDTAAAQAASSYNYDAAKGKSLYAAHCSACHQASGQGIPGAFPPLQDNPAVDDDDPTLHIDTILNGAHGKTINGVTYNGAMPPFAGRLNDVEVADIINYERTSWGNQAKQVTPDAVARVRASGK